MMPATRRSTLFLALLGWATLAGRAYAAEPPQLPDTPAGRRMSAYLAAFNSEDPAKLESFLRSAFSPTALAERPVEPRLAFHAQVRGEQGGFEVLKVVDSQPAELALEVRGRGRCAQSHDRPVGGAQGGIRRLLRAKGLGRRIAMSCRAKAARRAAAIRRRPI